MKNIAKIGIKAVAGLCSVIIIYLLLSAFLAVQSSSIIFKSDISWSKINLLGNQTFVKGKEGKQIELTSNVNLETINYKADILKNPNNAEYDFVIYLHGNAGRLDNIVTTLGSGSKSKLIVVSPAYPGYHESEGPTTTDNVYQTSVDTYNYLVDIKGIPESKISIFGHSLGGSPATYLASLKPNAKQLILVNTFSSIQSMCYKSYSIFCIFSGGTFNTAKSAEKVTIPVRQFHLKTDQTVPFEEGKTLFTYFINAKDKKFIELEKYTHSILDFDLIFKELNFNSIPVQTQQMTPQTTPQQVQPVQSSSSMNNSVSQ